MHICLLSLISLAAFPAFCQDATTFSDLRDDFVPKFRFSLMLQAEYTGEVIISCRLGNLSHFNMSIIIKNPIMPYIIDLQSWNGAKLKAGFGAKHMLAQNLEIARSYNDVSIDYYATIYTSSVIEMSTLESVKSEKEFVIDIERQGSSLIERQRQPYRFLSGEYIKFINACAKPI